MLLNFLQRVVWHSGAVKKKLYLKQTETLGIIELTSQYDAFLAENLVKYGTLGSGNTSYLFKTIYKELIIHFMVRGF